MHDSKWDFGDESGVLRIKLKWFMQTFQVSCPISGQRKNICLHIYCFPSGKVFAVLANLSHKSHSFIISVINGILWCSMEYKTVSLKAVKRLSHHWGCFKHFFLTSDSLYCLKMMVHALVSHWRLGDHHLWYREGRNFFKRLFPRNFFSKAHLY